MPTSLEQLRAARALLEDPAHWTQGAFARDVNRDTVPSHSERAVSWCAEGALFKNGGPISAHNEPLQYLANAGPGHFGVTDYNDDLTSHASLLAWFDRAIALAEGS